MVAIAEVVIVFKGIFDWLDQFGTDSVNSERYYRQSSCTYSTHAEYHVLHSQ